jgi:hypothetical protein
MAPASAIAMPAQLRAFRRTQRSTIQKIRIAGKYFSVIHGRSPQIRADRVALYLLITSTDGV